MKIFQKVNPIEVKRTFVMSQKIRLSEKKKGKKFLPKLTREEYLKKLKTAKEATLKMSEKQLDKFIADEYKKRAKAYNNSDWFRAEFTVDELGVWRRAGGLPFKWTDCTLAKTAKLVKNGLDENSKLIKARSKRAIPRIMELADIISKQKYLYPIVFQNGTGTNGRRWCKQKVKGDLDDGCMRSLSFAILGFKKINVYFGRPKSIKI